MTTANTAGVGFELAGGCSLATPRPRRLPLRMPSEATKQNGQAHEDRLGHPAPWIASSIAFSAMWAAAGIWSRHRSRLHRAQKLILEEGH